jgi:hypothetical protein
MLGPGRSMMMDACDDSNVDLSNCIFALLFNFGWILAVTIGMVDVERIAPASDDGPSIIRRTQVLLAIGTVIAILGVFGACTYRLRPSPRALHSNDDAADSLTAVKVPPVQSALQTRPLIASCILQFTGYTVSASVHWCLPPSIFSCICVKSCHVSRYWTSFVTASIASSSLSLAGLGLLIEGLCTAIMLFALSSINARFGTVRVCVRAYLFCHNQARADAVCTGTSRLVLSSLQQPACWRQPATHSSTQFCSAYSDSHLG